MPVKQLIVGWNRGGLGYVHQLLTKAGYDAGLTFGPDLTLESFEKKLDTAHQIEVSPYVVPFLDHAALKDTRVFFILRDPMRVLNSLYYHGFFHNERPSSVQNISFAHLPGFANVYRGKPSQAACVYLKRWLELAHTRREGIVNFRVEEGPAALLKGLTGSNAPPPFVLPDVNSSGCRQTLLPSKLTANSRHLITQLVVKLGYREWSWMPRGGHAHYVNADWHC